jgi:hypothetical protein
MDHREVGATERKAIRKKGQSSTAKKGWHPELPAGTPANRMSELMKSACCFACCDPAWPMQCRKSYSTT